MKTSPARFATTYTDAHDEALTVKALHSIAARINDSYLPLGVEHDPRHPPVGRLASAVVVALDDGAHAVAGMVEMFEDADSAGEADSDRTAHLLFHLGEHLTISEDRSFNSSEDQAMLQELSQFLSATRKREAKKAVESIAVLTFAFKAIATGGLGVVGKKLGEATWDRVVPKLRKLPAQKRSSEVRILKYSITTEVERRLRLVEILLTNPNGDDLAGCKESVLQEALATASTEIEKAPFLVRIVFSYAAADGLKLLYSVASNGVPLHGRLPEQVLEPGQGLSFGAQIDDA